MGREEEGRGGSGEGLSVQPLPGVCTGRSLPLFVLASLALLTLKPLGNSISLGSREVTEPILKVEWYKPERTPAAFRVGGSASCPA